ncbi:MAG: helix-turn-helix domain-containing protein, partial [bacterium]
MNYNKNYYVVQGWMIHDLKLSGTELEVFALIHGFTQSGNTYYTASNSFLENFLRKDRKTIIKAVKNLVNRGLIIKNKQMFNKQSTNHYQTAFEPSGKNTPPKYKGSGKSPLGVVEKVHPPGSGEIPPNNNNINNYDNNNKDNVEKLDNLPYKEIIN